MIIFFVLSNAYVFRYRVPVVRYLTFSTFFITGDGSIIIMIAGDNGGGGGGGKRDSEGRATAAEWVSESRLASDEDLRRKRFVM